MVWEETRAAKAEMIRVREKCMLLVWLLIYGR